MLGPASFQFFHPVGKVDFFRGCKIRSDGGYDILVSLTFSHLAKFSSLGTGRNVESSPERAG